MTMIDINCWERGCACYDSRIADETVEVIRREWVGLTDEERNDLYEKYHDQHGLPKQGYPDGFDYERAIEAKLRSKNENL